MLTAEVPMSDPKLYSVCKPRSEREANTALEADSASESANGQSITGSPVLKSLPELALWLQESPSGGNRSANELMRSVGTGQRQSSFEPHAKLLVERLRQRAKMVELQWFGPDEQAQNGRLDARSVGQANRASEDRAAGEDNAERHMADIEQQQRAEAMAMAQLREQLSQGDWVQRVGERAPEDQVDAYVGYIIDAVVYLRQEGFRNATPQMMCALIDCEVGTTWSADTKNNDSNATGLTQFISKTWLTLAAMEGTALNERIALMEVERGEPLTNAEVLGLRVDPELSIAMGVQYAVYNLEQSEYRDVILQQEGVQSMAELSERALFHHAYIAHHEGVTDQDDGRALQFVARRQRENPQGERLLTATKWKSNAGVCRSSYLLAKLRAAGLRDDMLPASVHSEVASGGNRGEVIAAYFKTLPTIEPQLRVVLETAYVDILDSYTDSRADVWGLPSAVDLSSAMNDSR